MKIKPQHIKRLRDGITAGTDGLRMSQIIANYENGNIAWADKVKDLQRRFCFDMLLYIPTATLNPLMSEIYEYANDNHIYTALKSICPKITRKY